MRKIQYIIGIDEVGRGPLAGPVTVAAVAIPRGHRFKIKDLRFKGRATKPSLKDSKKLTEAHRNLWFDFIKTHPRISFAVAKVHPTTIDKINVAEAANLAATRAFKKLATSHWGIVTRAKVLLDGSLYLNEKSLVANGYTLKPRTIVKGDEKYSCIKLASIVAKVHRDRYMKKLHKKYPQYAFHEHKGYGTRKHIAAIKKHGPSPVHRLTFLRKYITIKS